MFLPPGGASGAHLAASVQLLDMFGRSDVLQRVPRHGGAGVERNRPTQNGQVHDGRFNPNRDAGIA